MGELQNEKPRAQKMAQLLLTWRDPPHCGMGIWDYARGLGGSLSGQEEAAREAGPPPGKLRDQQQGNTHDKPGTAAAPGIAE